MTTTADIPEEKAAEVAKAALCDVRSVQRYFMKWTLRPLLEQRIERALTELGMQHLIRKAAE